MDVPTSPGKILLMRKTFLKSSILNIIHLSTIFLSIYRLFFFYYLLSTGSVHHNFKIMRVQLTGIVRDSVLV